MLGCEPKPQERGARTLPLPLLYSISENYSARSYFNLKHIVLVLLRMTYALRVSFEAYNQHRPTYVLLTRSGNTVINVFRYGFIRFLPFALYYQILRQIPDVMVHM